MPWMKVRSQDGDKVQVFKRGADGRPEGSARGTFRGPDAESRADAQMDILRRAELSEFQQGQKYAGLNLTPPGAVRAVCQRGLGQDGGTELQRDTAQKIAAGQPLSPRTIRAVAKQFSKGRKDGDEQAHLLRGGDPGQSWFKTIAAALDHIDAQESTKSITTSDAGSAGFSVPEDDGVSKAVTMRKGMDVWVKQTNEKGVIKSVTQFGTTVKYRVETPSGVYLVGRKGIVSAAQKAIKDAAKAYDAVLAAESDVTADAVDEAVRSLGASWKLADTGQRIQMQKAYDALTAAKAVIKVAPDAVDQVKSFLTMAKAELQPFSAEPEPSPLVVPAKTMKAMTADEDAEITSLRRQHRYLLAQRGEADEADRQRIDRRLQIVTGRFDQTVKAILARTEQPTPVKAFAAIKACVDAIACGKATFDEQEQMMDAVEALREYASTHGGEAAVKSLVPLEEELYAEPDDGLSEWQQRVVRMIDEYQAKIAVEAPQE